MVKHQSLSRRTLAGDIFGELRRVWLQLAAWQLILGFVSIGAALAAHDVIGFVFLPIAGFAFRAVGISVETLRSSR